MVRDRVLIKGKPAGNMALKKTRQRQGERERERKRNATYRREREPSHDDDDDDSWRVTAERLQRNDYSNHCRYIWWHIYIYNF